MLNPEQFCNVQIHPGESRRSSQRPRMGLVWVGSELKPPLIPNSLSWSGIPSTRSGCSNTELALGAAAGIGLWLVLVCVSVQSELAKPSHHLMMALICVRCRKILSFLPHKNLALKVPDCHKLITFICTKKKKKETKLANKS